jgi:L-asparaginase II
LVELVRGEGVDHWHRACYAVMDAEGRIIEAQGDIANSVFPRSALKSLQVLSVIESGAADAYALSEEEIALCCASHSGEPVHVDIIKGWLDRLGLSADDLECGVHSPMGRDAAKTLYREGGHATALHNACSGKHSGFMTLALHLKAPVKGYTDYTHPAQRYIYKIVSEIIDLPLDNVIVAVDGCQVPVLSIPLRNLALGMARLINPAALRPPLAAACDRVVKAIQSHPYLIAGQRRFCTEFMQDIEGRAIVKMGAGGVFTAAIPDRNWGIALKMDDGSTQAAEVLLANLLHKFDCVPTEVAQKWLRPSIKNWNKNTVGHWQCSLS